MNTSLNRRRVLRQTAAALIFCTSLTMATFALTQQSQAGDVELFFNSGYNTCDAKVLAAFWNVDQVQAKATAGSKIRVNGKKTGKKLISQNLASGRSGPNPCNFQDSGLNGDDLASLSKFWGMSDMDAKSKVSDLLFKGRRGDVAAAVKNARG